MLAVVVHIVADAAVSVLVILGLILASAFGCEPFDELPKKDFLNQPFPSFPEICVKIHCCPFSLCARCLCLS
jgi:hypothetical protein